MSQEASAASDNNWWVAISGKHHGPFTVAKVAGGIRSGKIAPNTLLCPVGGAKWKPVSEWQEFNTIEVTKGEPSSEVVDAPNDNNWDFPASSPSSGLAGGVVRSARGHAAEMLHGLQEWDLKDELLPLNAANSARLVTDPVFWSVTLLGIIPLLIGTLQEDSHQLIAFALFFAGIWAVIFRYFIVRPEKDRWSLWIGSLFFTGIVGIFVLLFLDSWLPKFVSEAPLSQNAIIRLMGSILVTGFSEEVCKSVPVVAYLIWKRSRAEPATALMIGIFSGLGFAAFENVSYGDRAVVQSLAFTREAGEQGLVVGVRSAMVLAMLRSISLVFCHGVWSGIVAHFASSAVILKRHALVSYLIGISIAAILHGTYNWMQSIQPTFGSIVVGLSFMLFYVYVLRRNDLKTTTVNNEKATDNC